jgi:hypothetical protein
LKNGDFWRILEPVRQKSLCGVGVNKYFQGAGLMRECETKMFFWGCGLNPSLYDMLIRACMLSVAQSIYSKLCKEVKP